MSKLPLLPEWTHPSQRLLPTECYEELRALQVETWNAAIEAAAAECTQSDEEGDGPDCWDWHAKDYARAILNLLEPTND